MVATGNDNGDITIRSLEDEKQEVRLCHFEKDLSNKCEVTQVKFSIVKRFVLASAYANG